MRILVCGGRNYKNFERLQEVLNQYLLDIDVLIHGGARGADGLAWDWALQNQVPTLMYEAQWKEHGRSAGPIRNRQMLEKGQPDLVIAFPGGKGTANMVQQASDAGVEVFEVKE
jgi:hypothetical protein